MPASIPPSPATARPAAAAAPGDPASPNAPAWRWAGLVLLLTVLYLTPRLMGLDRMVAVDEPFWLGRSANFYRALWQGDLAATFQFAHPGVTTMWAGMVGYWVAAPAYVDTYDTTLGHVYSIHQRLRAMGLSELDVLIAARIAKIGLQAALFALSLVFLRRLFGVAAAAVAGIVIALDPWLIAHDQLLHVDGLVTIASLAAALALADAAIRDPDRLALWGVAGALAAVAWLTRITALALAGVAGLVLLAHVLGGDGHPLRARLRAATGRGLVWLVAAAVTTVVLWPALWVDAGRVVTFTVDWIWGAAAEGHEHPLFFRGEIHSGDPGALVYPVSLVWRLSVASSAGLALVAVAVAVPAIRRSLPERVVRAGGVLLLFAVVYVAAMTLGAKKFDRYVLPAHIMLDVIAALGLVAVLQWSVARRGRWLPAAGPLALAALLGWQAIVTLGYRPHYLAAYNPLLGGASRAEAVLHLGWGEGADEAARWLLAETGVAPWSAVADPPVVRIAGAPAPLGYLLPPPFVVDSAAITSAAAWRESDYYVATIQQRRVAEWTASSHGPTLAHLRQFPPAHVVWIEGVRYAEVWDLREIPPPPELSQGAAGLGATPTSAPRPT